MTSTASAVWVASTVVSSLVVIAAASSAVAPMETLWAQRVSRAALPVPRNDVVSTTFALGSSRALLDVHVPAVAELTGTVVVVLLGGTK